MNRVRKVQPLQHEFVKDLQELELDLKRQKIKSVAILTVFGILLSAYLLGMLYVVGNISDFAPSIIDSIGILD